VEGQAARAQAGRAQAGRDGRLDLPDVDPAARAIPERYALDRSATFTDLVGGGT
jgi:hypothetical protein